MPELDPRIITGIGDRYAALPSLDEGVAQGQQIQMRDMAMTQQRQAQAYAEQDRQTAARNRTRMGELLPGAPASRWALAIACGDTVAAAATTASLVGVSCKVAHPASAQAPASAATP